MLGERIAEFPVIQRTYTYTKEVDERGPENEEVAFSDNSALPMTADVQLVMRIDPSKVPSLYKRHRLSFDQMFEGPIRNDVRSAIAAETELVSVEYLYRSGHHYVIQKALARESQVGAARCQYQSARLDRHHPLSASHFGQHPNENQGGC